MKQPDADTIGLVTIHFKENSIPGLRRGELTAESKASLLSALLSKMPPEHICDKNCKKQSEIWQVAHRQSYTSWNSYRDEVEKILREFLK